MTPVLSKDVREIVAGALVLFVIITLAFGPYAFGDRTLMSSAEDTSSIYMSGGQPIPAPDDIIRVLDPGAGGWQTEPELMLEHDQVRREHVFPLWNPDVAYGQPLAADMQSQPFYPLTWVVVASRSVRAYDWFIILRFYAAALFGFLFLRLFVRFAAALAGAVGFAFTGYLLLYYNMPHVSVECLIPALLWAMELLVRRRSAIALVRLALVDALVVFGGMPESALLAFVFAYGYGVVRVAFDPEQRATCLSGLARLVGASVLGMGLSSCLLLPFAEFVHLSLNQHEARFTGQVSGLAADGFTWTFIAPYLTPLIYGPPYGNVFTNFQGWSGVRGWFGVSQSFFALVVVANVLSNTFARFRSKASEPFSPAPYLIVVAAILAMKRFGNPVVAWIGSLPGLDLITFPKYEEAVLGFCVAALAAIGIDRISAGKVRPPEMWSATFVILGLFTITAGLNKAALQAISHHRHFYAGSLAGGLLTLAIVAGMAWFAVRGSAYGPPSRFARVGAVIVIVEAVMSFFVPLWYVLEKPAPATLAPLSGAPFVDVVRRDTASTHERFFGEDGLLYPEWSSAFGILDVRDLNALYDERYLKFVRAFLPPTPAEDFHDRFVGNGDPEFRTPLEQRFLALSSVGYVAAAHPLGGDPSLLAQALVDRPADQSPTLRSGAYEIGGSRRDVTFMHAPRESYPVPVDVPATANDLRLGYAMAPDVWTNPALRCGSGVVFSVAVRDASGRVTDLLRSYIDPKHDVAARKWFDVSLPIRAWAGKPVDLLFSTLPGPDGSTCAAWAIWSGVGFDVQHDRDRGWPFHVVSQSPNASVYRFADPLPRLAVYGRVVTVRSDDDALALLTSSSFDPTKEAVVTATSVRGADIVPATDRTDASVRAGHIDSYASQLVRGTVEATSPSLVVLNDTAYPGWNAFVDGRPAPVVTADFMFRGVVIAPGRHSIVFRYQPRSFEIGVVLSSLSLLVMVLYPLLTWVSEKRVKA